MTLPAAPAALGQDEVRLYSRQLILDELGRHGQSALKRASVLVIGAGGLGSPVLRYLAAAGVGRLGIVEHDTVDASNLHRQILYSHRDIGASKAQAARAALEAANPFVEVEVHEARLVAGNAAAIVAGFDIVVDATDNFAARYLINDVCVALGKPNVSASILRFEGQVAVFAPGSGPCYRCVFPEPPPPELAPSCAEAGVLGVLPGVIGCLQATEVLKLILGAGEPLVGRLLTFDALAMRFRELHTVRRADCEACGSAAGSLAAGAIRGASTVPRVEAEVIEIDALDLAMELRGEGPIVIDVRTQAERGIACIADTVSLPIGELDERLDELPRDRPLVLYCHMGARSRRAAALLQANGYTAVRSLRGGIDAWSRHVDDTVVRY